MEGIDWDFGPPGQISGKCWGETSWGDHTQPTSVFKTPVIPIDTRAGFERFEL